MTTNVPREIRLLGAGREYQRVFVDGVEFPWAIAESGPVYVPDLDGLPVVQIPILADRVVVIDNSAAGPLPSNADQPPWPIAEPEGAQQ